MRRKKNRTLSEEGDCSLRLEEGRYVMRGSDVNPEILSSDPRVTSKARLEAHWRSFLRSNGIDLDSSRETLEAGSSVMVMANGGRRHADVLAVLGDRALVEYHMPAGTSSLRIISSTPDEDDYSRNASYWRLPCKWLVGLSDNDVHWVGNPQQCARPPQPPVLLKRRQRVADYKRRLVMRRRAAVAVGVAPQ